MTENFLSSITAHRSKSYGNRKPIVSSMKRRDSSKDSKKYSSDSTGTNQSTVTGGGTSVNDSPIAAPPPSYIKPVDDEPQISERAGYAEHHSDSSSDGRHVQFDRPMGKGTSKSKAIDHTEGPDEDSYDDDSEELRKRKA